jgi:transcriptional regulator with XRE-family HTH domain
MSIEGKHMQSIRSRCNLTLQRVASTTGLSVDTIVSFEEGSSYYTETLRKLRECYGIIDLRQVHRVGKIIEDSIRVLDDTYIKVDDCVYSIGDSIDNLSVKVFSQGRYLVLRILQGSISEYRVVDEFSYDVVITRSLDEDLGYALDFITDSITTALAKSFEGCYHQEVR